MSKRLDGKVAIVTGGGGGIGEAIAIALSRQGADVLVSDIAEDRAEAVANALRANGGNAQSTRTDVSDPAACRDMIDTAFRCFGKLDVLVNNAGIGEATRFLDISPQQWERTLGVNLGGVFHCCQHAIRRMLAANIDGRIVNISSISGQRGGTGRGVYGVSKAGVEIMTKILAVEFGDQGIRVNAIAPGPVHTDLTRAAHTAETVEAYRQLIPMRRYGAPEEVADAAVYLASDESRYVCGHVLNVDGGFLAAGYMERHEPAASSH